MMDDIPEDEYKKLRDERMQELYYLGVLLVKSFNCSVNNTMLIMVLLILWLWLHQKHFQPGFEDILPESDDSEDEDENEDENEDYIDLELNSRIYSDIKSDKKLPVSEDSINIKLIFSDHKVLLVSAKLHETIAEFKRKHFSSQLSSFKRVSLLYYGVELIDRFTVCDNSLYNNCVVYCLIRPLRHIKNSDQIDYTMNSDDTTNIINLLFG